MSHFLRVNIQTPSMRHFCDVPNYTALLRDIVNEYGHTFGGGGIVGGDRNFSMATRGVSAWHMSRSLNANAVGERCTCIDCSSYTACVYALSHTTH